MKEADDFKMDELLAAYLLGEATTEERTRVEQWLEESPDNRKRFDDFEHVWVESKAAALGLNLDADAALQRFHKGLPAARPQTKVFSFNSWMKAAAILLLVAGGSWVAYNYTSKPHLTEEAVAVSPATGIPVRQSATPSNNVAETTALPDAQQQTGNAEASVVSHVKNPLLLIDATVTGAMPAKYVASHPSLADNCKAENYVCNNTPCPLEVCILQKSDCNSDKPYTVSNCSVITPDEESGTLFYKDGERVAKQNCNMEVAEIRIKRISTGETIVLNENSHLSAQDAFEYITGQRKGEIVAGSFKEDCNSVAANYNLRISNQHGNLLFH